MPAQVRAGSRSPLTVRSCPSERRGSASIKRGRQAAAHAAAWFRAQCFNRPPQDAQRADCRGGQARRSEERVFRHWQLLVGHRPDGAHLVVLQPLVVDGAVQAEQVAELCGTQQACVRQQLHQRCIKIPRASQSPMLVGRDNPTRTEVHPAQRLFDLVRALHRCTTCETQRALVPVLSRIHVASVDPSTCAHAKQWRDRRRE